MYVAFNTSHLPVTVQLPQWWERLWLPVFDSSKVTTRLVPCCSVTSTAPGFLEREMEKTCALVKAAAWPRATRLTKVHKPFLR